VNREQASLISSACSISALAASPDVRMMTRSRTYWRRIESMLEFIPRDGCEWQCAMIGDADDGYTVRLSQEQRSAVPIPARDRCGAVQTR